MIKTANIEFHVEGHAGSWTAIRTIDLDTTSAAHYAAMRLDGYRIVATLMSHSSQIMLSVDRPDGEHVVFDTVPSMAEVDGFTLFSLINRAWKVTHEPVEDVLQHSETEEF